MSHHVIEMPGKEECHFGKLILETVIDAEPHGVSDCDLWADLKDLGCPFEMFTSLMTIFEAEGVLVRHEACYCLASAMFGKAEEQSLAE